MKQYLGKVRLYSKGRLLDTVSGARAGNISGTQRNEQVTDSSIGYSEETVAPFIECAIKVSNETNIMELLNSIDDTIPFEGDNGKTLVLHEAFCASPGELAGGDGQLNLRFVGSRFEER